VHPLGDHFRNRPGAPAVVAVVVAEVAHVDLVVGVGRPAVAAVLGVGGVREPGESLRVVVESVVEDGVPALAAEVGDQRVVGVEHEPRAARVGRHKLGPAVGQGLQLAVAVELVAKEVGEQVGARMDRRGDAWQPRLVDLE